MKAHTQRSDQRTISVITPVFNGEAHLQECMESLAASDLEYGWNVEHVIVDDGSTDTTALVYDATSRRLHARPHYISQYLYIEHCGKPGAVRNVGFANASGQYFYCLDHDD